MDESDLVEREKLGPPLATVVIKDCRVTFRRQARTENVWCVTTGPLGTFAFGLIDNKALQRVIRDRPSRDASRDASSRVRTLKWARVRIDDDFVIAVRARGNEIEFAFLFSDGASFGGASGGLPTVQRKSPLDVLLAWLSGRRGSSVRFFKHSEGDQ